MAQHGHVCLPALGGEQFDISDPVEQRQEASFFNWYTFAVSSGGFVGRVRRARVHRVGGEQKGMVPRVRCVRPVCAFGHARMDCRVSVLQKSAAWWKSHHKNLAGTVCGALLFNIQVCPLVGLASSPQTTSVDENIETLSGLLYQEIRKPNSSRAEKYLKY
jgi:hypothetical protein